jgi:hypothetical protein
MHGALNSSRRWTWRDRKERILMKRASLRAALALLRAAAHASLRAAAHTPKTDRAAISVVVTPVRTTAVTAAGQSIALPLDDARVFVSGVDRLKPPPRAGEAS